MNNKLEVIGIDHGWSMMKTISQVFVTGVKEITTTPALFGDVLEYEGKFYKVGTVRQEVKDTKVEDDSFYLLTLAAVAKELKRRGLAEAKVFLAVGLPLTRFGAEKNDFIKYLTKNKRVNFKYENESYHIEIDDVAVFPQCYAAVVDKIPTMAKKTLIVDIGSWTIDIMPVINKSPDESKCVTIPKGLITCMRSINEQCVRQLNGEVDESEIQNIMRYGRSDIDDEYFAIIKAEIEDFVDKVYNSIREFGYNLKTTPIVFVGGGAVVMKNFGSHDAKNIFYNLDVKANARGYAMAIVMYYTSQRNYMPGKEFGTARFENPKQVNKILADKDENFNRILSQNVKMSLDFRRLKLNGNILICGGSGAGKTFYEVKPNLMQMPHNCSFICTDPKGEILRSCGQMLKNNGYNVKVINLLEMDKSDCYNPFSYIREETDVVKLITNLISNTTPKGATPSDPFWEKAEGLFLQSIFYYVWLEVQPAKRNFETVLKLLGEAEVTEQGKASKLDVRMKFLEESSPLGANHPAVKQYNKCMRGAGDTVRSIIISANSRLAFLENKQVLRLLSKDELNLSDIGIGVNGDGETKTALFCVIPDSDKSYNFIIGMLYTQIFQELYYQADFNCGGRLPIHVTFMLDEFANVALPDDFCSLLSTMRSREISSIIIIQNFAQLKALFKDTWETIPGNCDTFIYLGGNEQSTHKYVSELLGKGTIDKKSSGETKGRQGSSSRNYDVLGRELFTPDEVRKLDNKKCIIFIRGFDPIMDNKFIPFNHPMFNQTADGKGKPYVHQIRGADNLIGPPFEILSDKAVKYYEKLKDKGENVYIDSLTYEQFMMLGDAELSRRFSMQDEAEQKAKIDREQANELEYVDESQKSDAAESANVSNGSAGAKPVKNPEREKPKWEDTITNRMLHWSYTPEQKEEVKKALAAGVPKATILTYFYPEVTVEKMSSYRKKH